MEGCSMKTIKIILFVLNIIFVLGGLLLIIIGILLVTKGITSFSDDMKLAQAFIILILLIGIVVFAMAFFGVCGAINESPWMLNTYGGLIIVVFLCQVALIIVAICYRDDAMKFLKSNMSKSLKNENEASKLVWDKIQSAFECCGTDGPSDYSTPSSSLPQSCCKPGVSNCEQSKAFPNGCYDGLRDFVMDNFWAIVGVGIIIALVQIIAAVMAFLLVAAINKENESPI